MVWGSLRQCLRRSAQSQEAAAFPLKKVILTMCADNGIVAEGVSQSGQEVTAVVAGFMGQQASSVGKMARRAGVDVIPVDIGINTKETLPGCATAK